MYPMSLDDVRPLRSFDSKLIGADLLDSVAYPSSQTATTVASYDTDLANPNTSQVNSWPLSTTITTMIMSTTKSTMTSIPSTVTYNGMIGYNATDPLVILSDSCNGSCSFDLPIEIQILMCLLYGTLALTAIASNMIVCYIVLSNQRMRTATNYFIVNLAVGDILMALLCIPFTFPANLIFQYWPFGLSLCVIVSYSQANSVFISAYTMVAISIDKYLAIMYPMRLRMSKTQAKIIVLVIWSLALITSLPTALLSSLAPASLDGIPTTNTVTAPAPSNIFLPESAVATTRLSNSTGSNAPALNLDISSSTFNDQKAERAKSMVATMATTISPFFASSSSASFPPSAPVPASTSSSAAAATTQQRQEQSKYFCQESWTFWPKGKYYYSMALMILQFVLPLFVLVITYSRIVIVVWGKRMPGEEDNARDARMARSKRKMIKMVIFCVIAFALTWLPFNALIVIGDMHPVIWERQDIMYIWFITHYLAMCHTTTNPLIYIWMNNRFRAGFKQVLGNLWTAIKRLLLLLSCYCCCLACLLSCSRKKYVRVASKFERDEPEKRRQFTSLDSPHNTPNNNKTAVQQLTATGTTSSGNHQSQAPAKSLVGSDEVQMSERPRQSSKARCCSAPSRTVGTLKSSGVDSSATRKKGRKRRQSHLISIQMTTVEYHGKQGKTRGGDDGGISSRHVTRTDCRQASVQAGKRWRSISGHRRHKCCKSNQTADAQTWQDIKASLTCVEAAPGPRRKQKPSDEGRFVIDTRQSSQSTATISVNTNTTSLAISALDATYLAQAARTTQVRSASTSEQRSLGVRSWEDLTNDVAKETSASQPEATKVGSKATTRKTTHRPLGWAQRSRSDEGCLARQHMAKSDSKAHSGNDLFPFSSSISRRPAEAGQVRCQDHWTAAGRQKTAVSLSEAEPSTGRDLLATDEDVTGDVFHQAAHCRPNGSLELLSDQFDLADTEGPFISNCDDQFNENCNNSNIDKLNDDDDDYEDEYEDDEELSPLRTGRPIEMRQMKRPGDGRRNRLQRFFSFAPMESSQARLTSVQKQQRIKPTMIKQRSEMSPVAGDHLFEVQPGQLGREKSLRRAILLHNHVLSSLDKLPKMKSGSETGGGAIEHKIGQQRSLCNGHHQSNHDPVKKHQRDWHNSTGDNGQVGPKFYANQSSSAPAFMTTNSFTLLDGKCQIVASNGSPPGLPPDSKAPVLHKPWISLESGCSPPSETGEPASRLLLLDSDPSKLVVRKSPTVYLINKPTSSELTNNNNENTIPIQ